MFFQDFLLDLAIKATFLLLAVSLANYALQTKTSAGVRHRLWAATFVALLLLPLLSATVPRWRLAILPAPWGQSDPSVTLPSPASPGVVVEPRGEPIEPELDIAPTAMQPAEFPIKRFSPKGIEASGPSESAMSAERFFRNEESVSVTHTPTTPVTAVWPLAIGTMFVVGFSVAIAPLLSGLLRNRSLGKNARVVEEKEDQELFSELCQQLTIGRAVKLLETEHSIVPMTWGIFRPVVILPSQWRRWLTETRRLVLLHELAHVKRLDVVYQCVARLACALFWFHPLVWYALRRLRIERELACDDCVLMAGERPSTYAKQLLHIAREYQSLALPPAVAMAQRSGLEQRVRALLDKARSHVPISPRGAKVLLLGSLVVVTLLAAVQLEAIADRPHEGKPAADTSQNLLYVKGRVIGPDGQPIAGARVVAVREYLANTTWKKSYMELSESHSGADGSYAMQIPKTSERFSDGSNFEIQSTHVLASKPGYGPDQRQVSETAGATDLNLAKAEAAIEGKIVDLEGRPLPGIQVRLTEIKVAGSPLDEWLEQAAENPATYSDEMRMAANGSGDSPKLAVFPEDHTIAAMDSLMFPVVESDRNGTFRLTGIGDDRQATLRLDGDSITSTLLTAVTREMPAVNMPMFGPGNHRAGKTFGTKFVVSAEPAQLICGRITDRETEAPVAGATIRLASYADNYWALDDFLTTRTNDQGEYLLSGVPKAPENSRGVRIEVIPPRDLPYFEFDTLLPVVAGLEPITYDIQLTRGMWIEGQATDKITGQPVRGAVAYYPHLENEHAKNHEAFDRGMHTVGYGDGRATDQQGRFRIPALPGAGAVRFVAETADKYELEGPTWGGKQPASDSWKLYHIMMPGNAMVRVDLPNGPTAAKVDVALTPSPIQRFRVVDEAGEPVTGYEVGGQFPIDRPTITGRGVRYWGEPQDEAECDIVLSGAEDERPLMFFQKDRELAAIIDAEARRRDGAEMSTVTLHPCAKLIGQLVFRDSMNRGGKLVAGYGAIEEIRFNAIGGDGQAVQSPPRKHLKYQFGSKASFEKDGSFSLVIPASTNTSMFYGGGAIEATILENVTLMPGQVLDLGVIELGKNIAAVATGSIIAQVEGRKSSSTVDARNQQESTEQESVPQEEKRRAAVQQTTVPAAAETETKQESATDLATLSFEGEVVDARGAAVAGAKLYFVGYKPTALPSPNLQPLATTNGKGRFQFQIKAAHLIRSGGDEWHYIQLCAAHPSFGVAGKYAAIFETTGVMRTATQPNILAGLQNSTKDKRLQLVADDQPIQGRVVSVDGLPIAGARIRVQELWLNDSGSLDAWEKAAKHPKADYYSLRAAVWSDVNGYQIPPSVQGYQLPSLIPDALSDSDGRFKVKGLGRERIVELLISGPNIESAIVKARTRSGDVVTVPHQFGFNVSGHMETYNPREFTHVAAPSVPVSGRVTDKETGEPIANMTVSGGKLATFSMGGKAHLRTLTDADGRYEIQGLSLSGEDELHFLPPSGSNYLPQTFRPNLKGRREALSLDIEFKPAPIVTGKVFDGRTGDPVMGAVQYFALQSNPHLPDYGRFKNAHWHETVTNPDGSFTITAVPGEGIVAFNALDHTKYKRAAESLGIGSTIQNGMSGMYYTVPHALMAWDVNALKEINVEQLGKIDVQIAVNSGENVEGVVMTAEGTPATDYVYQGRVQRGWSSAERENFLVEGYFEDQPRDLYFYHPATNSAAYCRMEGKIREPLVVELQPAATLLGRLLDKAGLPVAGVPITGSNIITNNLGRPDLEIHTDDEGRFQIPGIVPRQSYSAFAVIQGQGVPSVFKDIVLDKAEVKNLGDIRLERKVMAQRPKTRELNR